MDVFFGTADVGETKGVLAELNREVLTERKANIYCGLALDKMSKVGANIKTSMFMPKVVLRPVPENEQRVREEVETSIN